jgi:hypothetical protein
MRFNRESAYPLDEQLLAQAMFLHRGLYLEAYALKTSAVYIPYLYRGRMLASLPPLISLQIEPQQASLPLLLSARAKEANYLKDLSKFYYELLNKITWAAYDESIPFIGASILAAARGSISDAFKIALEIRDRGEIRDHFRNLQLAINQRDRVIYDIYLSEIKEGFTNASRSLGHGSLNPHLQTFYKLSTFWIPSGIKEAIEALLKLLPQEIKQRGNQFASQLLNQNSFQMLFLNHVKAIRPDGA